MTYSVRSINRQDETTTVSLATLSSNALQLFANLAIIAPNDAEAQINPTALNIEQQHERLVLWVANLGATHLGHSSLEYRLREADLVRNAIWTFLNDLCNSLLECETSAIMFGWQFLTLPIGREFLLCGDLSAMDDVYASRHNEGAYNYPDQSMTAIQQSMLEADYGSETTGSAEQEFNLILESIAETINCLYRIATRIRNPATRILTKKVLGFKMMDRESGVDLEGEYASLDREHLREVFKDYRSADILDRFGEQEISPQNLDSARREPLEFLAHRLAQANTLRRKQFAYWSRHRKKLDAASEATAQGIHVQQVQPQQASQTVFSTTRSFEEDRSVVPSLPTTATTLDPAKIDLGDTKEDDMRSFNNEQWGHGNALSQNALRHLEMIMSDQGSNTKVGQYLSHLGDSDFENQWLNQDLSPPRQTTRLDDDVASAVKYEASSRPHNSDRLAKELADDRNSRGDWDSADLNDLTPELDKLKAKWEERDEIRRKSGFQQRYSNIELSRESLPLEALMLSGDAPPDSAKPSVTPPQNRGKRTSSENFQAPESPHESEICFLCKGCGYILEEGKAFVLAGNRWHLECFRCRMCNRLFDHDPNLILLGGGNLICNNCTYSCSNCGNMIEDFGILAGNQAFCGKCSTCRNCKRKIEDLRYSRTAQGLFCRPCHESLRARQWEEKDGRGQRQQDINIKQPSKSVDTDVGQQDPAAHTKGTPMRYKYYVFTKKEDWRVADKVEIIAPQEELERKVAEGRKTNSVLEAMKNMSADRRAQISRLLTEKNLANEHGDAVSGNAFLSTLPTQGTGC
ncbi:hypothetical protein EPUS_02864 [Endocarpon pusillum Z07020]|uniref:LIM zinc-binding domain-containing protein n=1 Tax=Endocarpon pusillum (strain Z07020 / HMAS-L-300199) TaxID=1263415 RepID=U1G5G9_ENDPU|nr:uncharacterized protein EPUS_02864 [Endocarpon pusillum Z07020]ERF72582.1 hypothetical protein EPUS_02864 [Endocarpon pusillum Z07020]